MVKEVYSKDVNIGDEMPRLVKDAVTHIQLVRYAGASGDFNPLHIDPEVSKTAGIGGQIAHGMLIMGFVGQAITNWIPKINLKNFSVRFAGMTRLGDTITITGKVTDKKQQGAHHRIVCEVLAKNQKDESIVVGQFQALLSDGK